MGVLTRPLRPLDIPGTAAVLDLLPLLDRALTGQGPAWLPVAVSGPERDRTLRGLRAGEPLGVYEDDDADPTAFVLATSGSTGLPKGALLPVGALRASISATADRLDPDGSGQAGQWLLALAAHHIAGLQVLLRSVVAGTEPIVMDLGDSFSAARFTTAAATMTGPRKYTSLVPTQLARILDDPEATAALAEFDAVMIGGAATASLLLERASAAGITAVTTYGMSETCGGCVYSGRPLAGVRVHVDAAPGEVGRVALLGPVVARGYRDRPKDPAFGPGVFRTGDLGQVVDGILTIRGRADDVIISGGLKLDPASLEDTLSRVPGVSAVGVCGVPDPEWGQAVVAVIVPTAGMSIDVDAIRRAALETHARFAVPKHVFTVDRLPLHGIGKPDRRALAAIVTSRLGGDSAPAGSDRRNS